MSKQEWPDHVSGFIWIVVITDALQTSRSAKEPKLYDCFLIRLMVLRAQICSAKLVTFQCLYALVFCKVGILNLKKACISHKSITSCLYTEKTGEDKSTALKKPQENNNRISECSRTVSSSLCKWSQVCGSLPQQTHLDLIWLLLQSYRLPCAHPRIHNLLTFNIF